MLSDRDRFLRTMSFSLPKNSIDPRPTLWEEGIREEVWQEWHAQGCSSQEDFYKRHIQDRFDLVEVDLRPIPSIQRFTSGNFVKRLESRYKPNAAKRFPKDWDKCLKTPADREVPIGMHVSRGTFLSLGVGTWALLHKLLFIMSDNPADIEAAMDRVTELSLWALRRVLRKITLDFAVFSEPIASFHAPVISPDYYRRFTLPHYTRLIKCLHEAGVEILIVQAYGNVNPLIPLWIEAGINTLRCFHANQADMNYITLRKSYGEELRLIGGIDARSLAKGAAAIDQELERTVRVLMEQGGYLPMLDDRVRPGTPYNSYQYYRSKLEKMVGSINGANEK